MWCIDCPRFDPADMPEKWVPRPFCCNSEVARAQRQAAEAEARARTRPANDQPNRAARRRQARLNRRNGHA